MQTKHYCRSLKGDLSTTDRHTTKTMKAYIGYVTACKNSLLLGGVKHHRSYPFETTQQANAWTYQCVTANVMAHRCIAAWGGEEVEAHNPILLIS